MSASKQTAFDYIDEKSGVITDVSDKIWDYAELSLREYKSGELYAKVLKEEGFTVEHPFDNIETAFRASYGSGKPVIGILAENAPTASPYFLEGIPATCTSFTPSSL